MPHDRSVRLRRLAPVVAAALSLLVAATAHAATGQAATAVAPPSQDASRIVAVVNGDVISNADVDDRARLFALSTGLPMAPDVLDRLKPQITRQLVDERLRMQEVQRRKIVVPDKEIAAAIHDIEQRNGLQPGALRQKLAADGVSQRTLIDQIRTQLGWSQVLRQQLGDQAQVTDAQVAEQQRLEAQLVGKPEYRVGEIFIPVDDPATRADAERFAETVIAELRKGAAFPVVAAQFSQTQTALQGGELGWVQPNQLDPEVAHACATDAGRRDQQSGAGAWRIFHRHLAGQARGRPRHRHHPEDARDVPAVHDAAQSAGADGPAAPDPGKGARHQRQRA